MKWTFVQSAHKTAIAKAREASACYASPSEEVEPVKRIVRCSECNVELSGLDADFGTCKPCWNRLV